jgi:hypothetical protein
VEKGCHIEAGAQATRLLSFVYNRGTVLADWFGDSKRENAMFKTSIANLVWFMSSLALRMTTAFVVAVVWMFTHESLSTFIELLRVYPVQWLISLVKVIVMHIWNPAVGFLKFPTLQVGNAAFTNVTAIIGSGQTLLLPSIAIGLAIAWLVVSALLRNIFFALRRPLSRR